MKKKFWKVFIVVLGNIFIMMIIIFGQNFFDKKVYCSARLQQGMSVEKIKAGALEQFTIWEEIRGASFSNPALDRKCTGECVYIVGELDKLQEWNLIDGTLFLDDKGVIITDVLAKKLFNSVYVVGEKLEYQQSCYYVRGVVLGERSKVYISAAFQNGDSNDYEWAACVKNGMGDKNLALTNISYAADRKKCLFKKIPDMLQFQLEKNGYPEIDMLLYPKN